LQEVGMPELDAQSRVALVLAIKRGLDGLEWRLLKASERALRNPEEGRRRQDVAAEKIAHEILTTTRWRIEPRDPPGLDTAEPAPSR
jgi:hypothetical protein